MVLATSISLIALLVASFYVRFVLLVIVFLSFAGWTLAHWPQPGQLNAEPEFTWRRTEAGWERIDRWPTYQVDRFHGQPLLVGTFQLGVSLLALMAGNDAERRRARRVAPQDRHDPETRPQVTAKGRRTVEALGIS
jgi:hypothetical protein